MPVTEPRRSSSNRAAKHPPRSHSRASSQASTKTATHAGFGPMTAINGHTSRERESRNDTGKESKRKNGSKLPTSRSPSPPIQPPKKSAGTTRHVKVVTPASLAAGNNDDDEDWVSSESGAATPSNPEPSPVNRITPHHVQQQRRSNTTDASALMKGPAESRTPPAVRQPLPPAEPFLHTASPTGSGKLKGKAPASPLSEPVHHFPSMHHGHHQHGLHPHPHLHRPHPLIRATSHTTPLASPSLLTATPSQSTPLSESPPSSGSPPLSAGIGGRKPSFSSARSVATLPVPSSATGSIFMPSDGVNPRQRTLSSMSTSSAALSSLSAIPRLYNSRQMPHPPPIVSHFIKSDVEEDRHHLLRQPFLVDHVSILHYYDPQRDSARRVAKARQWSDKAI